MDRERIGLDARVCQMGQHRQARRLTVLERSMRLLRGGLVLGWLYNLPLFRLTAGWLVLLGGSVLFYLLSLLLSACERLIQNRWMHALRQKKPCALSDLLVGFSRRDVSLAVRIAAFYRLRLFGRGSLLFAVPILLTASAVWRVFNGGVGRMVFFGGAVGLFLLWSAAFLFVLTAWEPLQTTVSLLTDRQSFTQRKSSLARLDKDCFQLTKFSFSWLFLPRSARFQAKAIYASIRQ